MARFDWADTAPRGEETHVGVDPARILARLHEAEESARLSPGAEMAREICHIVNVVPGAWCEREPEVELAQLGCAS